MMAVPTGVQSDAARARLSLDRGECAALGVRLASAIGGEINDDLATRALYASDASNYRVVPALVVAPRSADEVRTVLALASAAAVPVTLRGAGTSIAGNACGPGVVLDTSRHLTAVRELDPVSKTVTVEPGVVLDALNRVAVEHELRVGPDPSSHSRCTIGGMIGNNACGSHSIAWGTTAESVLALELALADGSAVTVGPGADRVAGARGGLIVEQLRGIANTSAELLRTEMPPWPRRVSGYALDWLLPERGFDVAKALAGSEGTCAVVLAATLRLIEPPASRALLVVGFADDVAAAEAAPHLTAARPLTVECVTRELLGPGGGGALAELLPEGRAWLLVEAGGGSPAEACEHAARLAAALGRRPTSTGVRLLVEPAAQAALWRVREDGSGRATRLPDDSAAWPGWEDAVVPPERLAAYLAGFHTLLDEHGLRGTTYGHFGEGCVHVRIGFDFRSRAGVDRFRRFLPLAADLVVAHGGSLSGEHGDGRARSALLPRMFSAELLALFGRFKAAWDPAGQLNPGIIVAPAPLEAGVRPARATSIALSAGLAYTADYGDFRSAVERCVGVGKCVARGTPELMCPSYRATGDERDSTRGRARLLQEMIAGALARDGWRSEAVRDALDLCLSCKGCLHDCPTGVDMASYKSEFLNHFYRRRVRPRSHYSLGWLPLWLRVASHAPRLANAGLRSRPLTRLLAVAGGIAPERRLPSLPSETFVQSFARSATPSRGPKGTVVLWPDTWTNHIAPEVGRAAVRVLTAAGFGVTIPRTPVCCGLTWLTTGQLGQARRTLRGTLDALSADDGQQVVVLEPSCAAALRVDGPELLAGDPRARQLADRVTTLAELLDQCGYGSATGCRIEAVAQPHCHQQAVLGFEADRAVLERSGVELVETLIGCCGLAGNFGMEVGHQAVSRAVAELTLLPALERAGRGTTVLADGFSCRVQIATLTGRRALHMAEVLARQLDESDAHR